MAGLPRPIERVVVAGQVGSEADLDAGPVRTLDGLDAEHGGGAIALRTKLDTLVAGDDGERALAGQHRTSDHAQAVADSAARRQPQVLRTHHRSADAEQAGDVFGTAVDAGTVVIDDVAALDGQSADLDNGSGIEPIIGQLFQDQFRQLIAGDTGLLGQAVETAE